MMRRAFASNLVTDRRWLPRLAVVGCGDQRNAHETGCAALRRKMAAGVSKLMRNQDLILIARKCQVTTRFRNTIGLPGRMSVRLQPNYPFDDVRGITASILDGLLLGSGDACIGINPASDDPKVQSATCCGSSIASSRGSRVPTQSCVLTHVTTTLGLIGQGAAGRSGVPVHRWNGGRQPQFWRRPGAVTGSPRGGTVAAPRHGRRKRMYFETGQGSALSANANHMSISRPARRGPMRLRAPSIRSSSTASSDSSARKTCTTARRSSAPASRIILREAARPAARRRRLLHQPRRRRPG